MQVSLPTEPASGWGLDYESVQRAAEIAEIPLILTDIAQSRRTRLHWILWPNGANPVMNYSLLALLEQAKEQGWHTVGILQSIDGTRCSIASVLL